MVAAAAATPSRASFLAGDCYRLPFATASFEIVHAHQVLQHLVRPETALLEMRRVATSIVAVTDADYSGMIWWPNTPELARWMEIYQEIGHRNGVDPNIGRRLGGIAAEAGLHDSEMSVHTWIYSTMEQREWWAEIWAGRVLDSNYASLARRLGVATDQDLEEVALGWRRWAGIDGAHFTIPNFSLIARIN